MMRISLAFPALLTFGLMGAHVALPLPEPNARLAVPRSIAVNPPVPSHTPVPSYTSLPSYTNVGANVPEARQAPVPLVRSVHTPYVSPKPLDEPKVDAEVQTKDEQDRKAAKAAIEADGYKRAGTLTKGVNGTWRAKAFRGATQVQLTVDSMGNVSAD